ncbi:hypothetical protein BAE44_0009301 [Dichanthelium oligosanthes]|uniref:Uncharacterized protein n=1 Tax=Dichanthelium oligosanthes TaxID=888268 RepID=A0A1E5VX38_9POAL|nr:hypothetical protein BAE44_0009301 [Dichanthelium oligosanthes]
MTRYGETPCPIIPAAAAAGGSADDLALCIYALSSRDGFLLLERRLTSTEVADLCLCNPMTGDSTFLPAAAFKADTYVLVTGHDLSPSDDVAVRIIAVTMEHHDGVLTLRYQHYSSSTSPSGDGAWGAVKSSDEFKKGLRAYIHPSTQRGCLSRRDPLAH